MQTDIYIGNIPTIFDRFSELIGAQHWKKRVELLKSEIRGSRLLKDHLVKENELAFDFQEATDLIKKYGAFPIHERDCSSLYSSMGFASQILSIADASGSKVRDQLVRRVHGALKNPDDMRGLRLELMAATHFIRRGLDVQWPETIGDGTMDLKVPALGPQGLEVECKSISDDKGRKIHKREALDFFSLISPQLNDLGKNLTMGISAVLTLEGRMSTNFSERKNLAQSVVRNILSGSTSCQLDGAQLRIHEFDLSLLGDLGEDGHPVVSRRNIDQITGTNNRQALIVGRKSGGAIVLVLQSNQDDALLTYLFNTLSKSANKQLSGCRAGMFLVGFDGLEAVSLIDLAQQESDASNPPSALRVQVSDFLMSQGREHVVGVGFLSKGALRTPSGGVIESGGSAYVFPKKTSQFWHPDFSGLFAERT